MRGLLMVLTVTGMTMGLVPSALPVHASFPGSNGRIVFDSAFLFFQGAGSSQIYSVHPKRERPAAGHERAGWILGLAAASLRRWPHHRVHRKHRR
jgi:hypothetical protein